MIATKPMLAEDAVRDKLRFPLILQPKIDGVRGINLGTRTTGRSLKGFDNQYASRFFSSPELSYLDGEFAAAAKTDPALCRLTTSALSTITGEPFLLWHVFDFLRPGVVDLPYIRRLESLSSYVVELQAREWNQKLPPSFAHLRVIDYEIVKSLDELDAREEHFLGLGYEGVILRDPMGSYKNGRSTVREGGLLRIKQFIEEEAIVLSVEEGQTNTNEAKTNPLGYTERSTIKENMLPNGMVGKLICRDIKTGNEITVAPGKMLHQDRVTFFEQQNLIIGKTIKYKHFPRGVKDKCRFPTFQSIRMSADI